MLQKNYPDVGLLILRLTFGLSMLFAHGWPKLAGFTEKMAVFPDPIGLGSEVALALAVFAEVFCAALIVVGFKTKYFVVPLIITMLVAVFIIHGNDPFKKMEMGLLYLTAFTTLFFTGPGAFSMDRR
ncbi:MAG: transmembrane DoxX protein [Bdellovibrionaceae bacterium]|nr:transmembrane DoxX protein [Pseudobdellovibrionaceae bacterium]|tara:strand:+ start:35097 stop:35477 length:381 start_codon:yes stop_codon:yes gene_type:complete